MCVGFLMTCLFFFHDVVCTCSSHGILILQDVAQYPKIQILSPNMSNFRIGFESGAVFRSPGLSEDVVQHPKIQILNPNKSDFRIGFESGAVFRSPSLQ